MLRGISSSSTSEATGEDRMLTGSRLDAAVEGLMSRSGSGWRLIETD